MGLLGIVTALFWIRKAGMGEGIGSPETGRREKQGKDEISGQISETEKQEKVPEEQKTVSFARLFAEAPLVLILLAIILQGTLRDGMTTWMPVYMKEVFGMSSAKSILSAAALPVFGVFSTLFASILLSRLKSEVFTAALLFGAGMIASTAMLPFYDNAPAMCILMMTLITGCMHGVNLMLISRVPGRFTGFGKVSTVSGVLNAATYIGSSLSTYGFGAVADRAGWLTVILLWAAVGLLGAVLMLAARRKWDRFCGGR